MLFSSGRNAAIGWLSPSSAIARLSFRPPETCSGRSIFSTMLHVCYWPWLCENSTRYNRTRNFGLYGHAETKKTQKVVFLSVLRPNQISFSHGQGPKRRFAAPQPYVRSRG